MSHIIQDGTGTKKKVAVDSTNKMQVRSVSEPSSIEALNEGNQYVAHSAVMNLTSASNSYIGFIQNDAELDLIIKVIEISSEFSNEGTGTNNQKQTATVRIRKNPTGPSFSNAWAFNNADFGSANTATTTAYTGAFGGGEGGTFTDNGDLIIHDLIQCGAAKSMVLDEVKLRTGNTIGFGFQPPAGNTDIDVHINIIAYFRDSN